MIDPKSECCDHIALQSEIPCLKKPTDRKHQNLYLANDWLLNIASASSKFARAGPESTGPNYELIIHIHFFFLRNYLHPIESICLELYIHM